MIPPGKAGHGVYNILMMSDDESAQHMMEIIKRKEVMSWIIITTIHLTIKHSSTSSTNTAPTKGSRIPHQSKSKHSSIS
jgi:hypothetical protein